MSHCTHVEVPEEPIIDPISGLAINIPLIDQRPMSEWLTEEDMERIRHMRIERGIMEHDEIPPSTVVDGP